MLPWCRESPQITICCLEWLGRLKCLATGVDAFLSSFSMSRRCSRNLSPSRLPVSPMCNFLQSKECKLYSRWHWLRYRYKPNNPGRPIVSACSCPTELISSYFDKIMAPIVRSLPSYVKESQHSLQIFRDFNFLGEDKLIFTMDITSLYTVIPNDLRTVK